MSSRFISGDSLAGLERWNLATLQTAGKANTVAADAARAAEFSAGFEEGRRAGLKAGQAAAAESARRLLQAAIGAEQARDAVLAQAADALVDLALVLAQHVVRLELDTNRDSLLGVIRGAIAQLPPAATVQIFLNPQDAAAVREALAGSPLHVDTRLATDASLTRGGCRLISAAGEIDATLETRWRLVAAALGRADHSSMDHATTGRMDHTTTGREDHATL